MRSLGHGRKLATVVLSTSVTIHLCLTLEMYELPSCGVNVLCMSLFHD